METIHYKRWQTNFRTNTLSSTDKNNLPKTKNNLNRMDIKSIKQIVNSGLPDDYQEKAILSILADDKKVIPHIMEILDNERKQSKELILDTNAELSRALLVLNDENLRTNKKVVAEPKWVVGEIKKHYLKWEDYIKCNFKIEGLP